MINLPSFLFHPVYLYDEAEKENTQAKQQPSVSTYIKLHTESKQSGW